MLLGELFSPTDLVVVLVVVLLLFGGRKLPQLARSLGSASTEFKKGVEEGGKGDDAKLDPKAKTVGPPPQVAAPEPHQGVMEQGMPRETES